MDRFVKCTFEKVVSFTLKKSVIYLFLQGVLLSWGTPVKKDLKIKFQIMGLFRNWPFWIFPIGFRCNLYCLGGSISRLNLWCFSQLALKNQCIKRKVNKLNLLLCEQSWNPPYHLNSFPVLKFWQINQTFQIEKEKVKFRE